MTVSAHRAAEACECIPTRLSELRPRSCLSASGEAAHDVLCRRLRYETSRDIAGQKPSYSGAMRALGVLEEALASLLQGQDETWVAFDSTREYFYHAAPLHSPSIRRHERPSERLRFDERVRVRDASPAA